MLPTLANLRTAKAITRFNANMGRLQNLINIVFSNTIFKPRKHFDFDDIAADMLRMMVVFLHVSTEDFVRSQLLRKGKFTFSSASDIEKALKRESFDPTPLADLYPYLSGLTNRRVRIVHFADMTDANEVVQWGAEDTCDLLNWIAAVRAFHTRSWLWLGTLNQT